jgi:drug/metabolite transporter (DMT)-like permease
METTGLIITLFSSIAFAAGVVLVRKTAGEAGEAFSVTAMSICSGIIFFTLAVFITGDWRYLLDISWKAFILLVSAGVIHFIVGRLLGYNSFRLLGANRASVFTLSNRLYTVLFAVMFLNESFTVFLVFGVLLMFIGPALITMEKRNPGEKSGKKRSRDEVKGIICALGAALCWGITPVLIKPGVAEIGSSVAGAFVSYAAAAFIMGFMLIQKPHWHNLVTLPVKKSIIPMALAGVFTAGGQLLYYSALGMSPASIVASLLSIQMLFIFLFSYFLNRKIELFTPRVIFGALATIAGTILLVQ